MTDHDYDYFTGENGEKNMSRDSLVTQLTYLIVQEPPTEDFPLTQSEKKAMYNHIKTYLEEVLIKMELRKGEQ